VSQTLTIGIVGAGGIFRRRHLPALTDMDDIEIAAIANRSVESARAISDEFDLCADALDDPDAMLRDDAVDAVMIGTWPYRHHPLTMAALDRGKHVFVQARMAATLSEAKEMYARSEETDLVTQVCPSPFGMAGDTVVRELIDDGYLGDCYLVRGTVTGGDRIDPDAPIHWRDLERYQGINALAVGILIERLHRWIGRARTVSAVTATHIDERPSRVGEGTVPVDLPDVAAVHCEFENGATGSFDFSNVSAHAPTDQVELYGSDGTIVYDIEDDRLFAGSPEDSDVHEIEISDEDRCEWTVEADFVDAIRTGGQPRTTFREGIEYMTFSEAVCRSAQTGGTVELPLRT